MSVIGESTCMIYNIFKWFVLYVFTKLLVYIQFEKNNKTSLLVISVSCINIRLNRLTLNHNVHHDRVRGVYFLKSVIAYNALVQSHLQRRCDIHQISSKIRTAEFTLLCSRTMKISMVFWGVYIYICCDDSFFLVDVPEFDSVII